jgi:hydroxyacylglutathione hydrolase
MEIIVYRSPVPECWRIPGSFVDRNPNMSYLLYGEDKHAVLIDACSDMDAVLLDMQKLNLHLDCILLTHNHSDHTFPLAEWLKKFPDLPIGVHISSLAALASQEIGNLLPLSEGSIINVGKGKLRVMETPGHTTDSLCFWDEDGINLFTGDVVFGGAIGCSDYRNGGNRNIFYQTIVKLLKTLPRNTRIYPGHFSEHHQSPPPYALDAEKISNPYLANVLTGRRGNFDRALKIFSQEFETAEIIMLDESDIDAICNLEREIWIPSLQASRETILTRLKQNHNLLSVRENGELEGMLGWCYSKFSVNGKISDFPGNFHDFSNCTSCCVETACSAFIYNLGVRPAARRKGAGSLMLQEAFEKIRKTGISQVFIDSRLPSYNGSGTHPQENIPRNKKFHEAIDRYFSTDKLPGEEDLLSDPAVGFYMKNGLSPWLILRDFINDPPSGDMRVICFMDLDQAPPLSVELA